MSTLHIKNLSASVEDKMILKELDLTIRKGEIHAIMGPNGSGKSTLSKVIMGHPSYEVTGGDILFDDESLLEMETDERARKGIFLAFQSPQKIPGLPLSQFLRTAYNAHEKEKNPDTKPMSVFRFKKMLQEQVDKLKANPTLADRYLNEGFSGGEMKKTEVLQMGILKPQIALLDEIDSGLDIDALKVVCENVKQQQEETGMGLLMITHYNRILNYITPDHVHIMIDGNLVQSGDASLADKVEAEGYGFLMPEKEEKKPSGLKVLAS